MLAEERAAREAQILEAAMAVFAEAGFATARMIDIANAAGVSKGTLYLYFKDKDTLIYTLATHLFTQELAQLQTIHETPGTALERLNVYYETLIAEENVMLPLMPVIYEFYALGLRREDVRAVLVDYLQGIEVELTAIIREGIADGEFAPTEARAAARALNALMSGTFLHWVYAPDKVDIDAQLRYSIQLVLRGLASV